MTVTGYELQSYFKCICTQLHHAITKGLMLVNYDLIVNAHTYLITVNVTTNVRINKSNKTLFSNVLHELNNLIE